jgi:hypothetical protein
MIILEGQLRELSPDIATEMRDVKSTLLAGQPEAPGRGVTRAATSFKRIQEVAEVFKLPWTGVLLVGDSDPHSWKIEEEAVKKPHFNSSEKIRMS